MVAGTELQIVIKGLNEAERSIFARPVEATAKMLEEEVMKVYKHGGYIEITVTKGEICVSIIHAKEEKKLAEEIEKSVKKKASQE